MKNQVRTKRAKIHSKGTAELECSLKVRLTPRTAEMFVHRARNFGLSWDELASAIVVNAIEADECMEYPEIAGFIMDTAVELYPDKKRTFSAMQNAAWNCNRASDALSRIRDENIRACKTEYKLKGPK